LRSGIFAAFAPEHRRHCSHHRAQPVRGALGPVLLYETEQRREHDGHGDDRRAVDLARDIADDRQCGRKKRKRLQELPDQPAQCVKAVRDRDRFGTLAHQPRLCLLLIESGSGSVKG